MNPNLAMVHLNPGLVGGIVGAIIGVIGGLIGTYFSIKNTKGPRERAFMVKMSIVGWAFVVAFVFAMSFAPGGFYKTPFFLVYAIALIAGILLVNKMQAQIRLEESERKPAVPPTEILPRQCPQCGVKLKPDAPEGLCPACLLQRGIATEGGAPPGTPPFTPPPFAELQKLFPQLEILELLGQGGMGAVYKARQPALDRLVALKILAPRSGGDLDFAGRFTREARALAKLSHPNIVAVYDFGQVNGLSYFVMEYVDGLNLRQLERAGKLSPREALQIIPQICTALQFAHDEGVVHRDIKPENVLLDKKGRVKIADFGLAKILGQEAKDFRLTGAKDVMGTPHYMAPEQIEKPQTVDHRADIYSLGVVFYEMLTGELPLGKFQAPSKKVQIDVRLDEVVLRALEKEPERRYQQASEVKTRVETIAATEKSEAGNQKLEVELNPWQPAILITGSLIFAALLLFATVLPWPAKGIAILFGAFGLIIAGLKLAGLWPFPSGLFPRSDFTRRNLLVPARVPLAWSALSLAGASGVLGIAAFCLFPNPPEVLIWSILAAALLGICLGIPAHTHKFGRRAVAIGGVNLAIWLVILVVFSFLSGRPFFIGQAIRPNAFVKGMVTDATTGLPIVGARVDDNRYGANARRAPQQTWTEARGHYLFKTWAEEHTIAASAPGYETQLETVFAEPFVTNREVRLDFQLLPVIGSNTFVGQAWFPQGDSIELTSVERTADRMVVKGHYNLVSHDAALLAIYIISADTNPVPTDSKQQKQISKGRGDFEMIHPLASTDVSFWHPGLPHVSMYAAAGKPFAALYFGTKAEALEESKASWITNATPASAETWSPALAPGEKPDVQKIRDEVKTLMEQGRYEEALQRQIWYFNHSLQYGEINPIRLSFGIMNWNELGRRYPKAKQALTEIRDHDAREFSEGRGYAELFLEVSSLNRELQDDGATLALFKTTHQQDKQLAGQCYGYAENLLMQNGDYDLCLKCIGDPQAHFESFRRGLEVQRESQQRMDEIRKKYPVPGPPRLPGRAFTPPDMGQLATNNFVGQVCKLVEILVATDHKADAEKVRDEAVAVLDDPRLQSAVSDAEERVQKVRAASGPESSQSAGRSTSRPAQNAKSVSISTNDNTAPGVIDPATGLPIAPGGTSIIDPATGLPTAKTGTGVATPASNR